MTFAPVGIRCPDHADVGAARRRAGAARRRCGRRSGRSPGLDGAGDGRARRHQRARLHRSPSSRAAGSASRAGGSSSTARSSAPRSTRRRVVAARRRRCSSTRSLLHLAFNMFALYWLGSDRRAGARHAGASCSLYFVSGPRGLGGRARVQRPVRGHGRRLGRDLRDHGRAARARVPRDRIVRRAGDGADRPQPRDHLRDPEHLDRRPPRRARRRHRRDVRAGPLPRTRSPRALGPALVAADRRSGACSWRTSASRTYAF